MTLENLNVPKKKIDVVLDTDTYNEIDDQFAIAYMLRSNDKLNTVAIYAAPFYNKHSSSPADGMEKSYDEIFKIVHLCGVTDLDDRILRGSNMFLTDEKTPVISDAAKDLAERAMNYTPENPLYVIAIAAITNVASALLLRPEIADRIVIVWLGGHAHHLNNTNEFNMGHDIAAARVCMGCGCAFVQLPCSGVVSEFATTGPELDFWLTDKNPLADYLARNTIAEAESYAKGRPWSRTIWDVTAVAWLLNEEGRYMWSDIRPMRLPAYNGRYEEEAQPYNMCYVNEIYRDNLMEDLFNKLLK